MGRQHGYSALMPAARTTLPRFSVSSTINCPNSVGELVNGRAPSSASRTFIFGSTRPAFISMLSLSTISAGVFLGATIPNHEAASKRRRNSPIVGTSGSTGKRVAVVTASARSFLALTYSTDANGLPK